MGQHPLTHDPCDPSNNGDPCDSLTHDPPTHRLPWRGLSATAELLVETPEKTAYRVDQRGRKHLQRLYC